MRPPRSRKNDAIVSAPSPPPADPPVAHDRGVRRTVGVQLGEGPAGRAGERDDADHRASDERHQDQHPNDAPVQCAPHLDHEQVHAPTSSRPAGAASSASRQLEEQVLEASLLGPQVGHPLLLAREHLRHALGFGRARSRRERGRRAARRRVPASPQHRDARRRDRRPSPASPRPRSPTRARRARFRARRSDRASGSRRDRRCARSRRGCGSTRTRFGPRRPSCRSSARTCRMPAGSRPFAGSSRISELPDP